MKSAIRVVLLAVVAAASVPPNIQKAYRWVAAASVPPNVMLSPKFERSWTFGGTEAAATGYYSDRFLEITRPRLSFLDVRRHGGRRYHRQQYHCMIAPKTL